MANFAQATVKCYLANNSVSYDSNQAIINEPEFVDFELDRLIEPKLVPNYYAMRPTYLKMGEISMQLV